MVEAIARRMLTKGERIEAASQLLQTGATWLRVEADRLAWPDGQAVEVIVQIDRGKGWQEVGRFGAHGGETLKRDGTKATISAAVFRGRFPAGALVRACADAKTDLETAVRLTWG